MTGETEKRCVSTQQSELCIRAVHHCMRSLSNSLRGTNLLFRTLGASEQLLCHVINSCAMSSACPRHRLARPVTPSLCSSGFQLWVSLPVQTGMAAGIHRSAPQGVVRELSAGHNQAKVIRLQCLARAEESPALALVWTRQRMSPWLPCFVGLGAGTPPSTGDTNPRCVLVLFRNLQPQKCSNF